MSSIIKHFMGKLWLAPIIFMSLMTLSWALSYPLQEETQIVGETQVALLRMNQTLLDLGLRYNLGYYEVLEANPQLHPKFTPANTKVIMPTQFILPNAPREGVVVNLAELRMYLYPENGNEVITLPVGIGRYGWSTPVGDAQITDKRRDPKWYVPDSVYEDMKRRGVTIPRIWPPGPKNPLGKYAMRINIPYYDIHGTNRDDGIGRRSGAGCIRMLNQDVEEVYKNVAVGTKVKIINQPFKVGVKDKKIYLEAHVPLYEEKLTHKNNDFFPEVKSLLEAFLTEHKRANINWESIKTVVAECSGVPVEIGQL